MSDINKIFTKDVINYYKDNKNEITQELLDQLRETKEGKKIAFNMLDLSQNEEGYYLDSFGKEISYQKIPTLKNINRKLPLSEIHKKEIQKCQKDIYYFMRNYVKIKTPKGVDYPDLRYYQLEFLDCIIQPENESIIGLLPRQSGKSVTVGIYLCWLALFEKDINIGIAAQSNAMASEFLTKVKDIFMELPIWLTPGVKVWNVKSISLENGVRLMSDTASSNAFRGHTCLRGDTKIDILENGVEKTVKIEELYTKIKTESINNVTGLNNEELVTYERTNKKISRRKKLSVSEIQQQYIKKNILEKSK